MNLDNPLFVIPLLTGIILVLAGFMMIKLPPKKINSLYGYRTNSSMKSQERWDFSQKYAGRELMKFGSFSVLLSISGLFYNPEDHISVIAGLGITLVATIFPIIRTEKAIKTRFGKE